jgi:hypothetical protein
MADDRRFPDQPPKFEVWNYLERGLDMARNELDEPVYIDDSTSTERTPRLGEKERKLLHRWAELAFSGLTQLVLDPAAKDQELGEVRQVAATPGAEPWLNFAVDLRFAEEGVGRAQTALDRYADLRRARLPPGLSRRSKRYVAEAAHTFLFGFDAACIVFCGAAVEQEIKDSLVRARRYTDHTLRQAERNGRTGMTFLHEAKRAELIKEEFRSAETLLRARNEVLHRGIDKGEGLRDEALEHLVTMSRVFRELDTVAPRQVGPLT